MCISLHSSFNDLVIIILIVRTDSGIESVIPIGHLDCDFLGVFLQTNLGAGYESSPPTTFGGIEQVNGIGVNVVWDSWSLTGGYGHGTIVVVTWGSVIRYDRSEHLLKPNIHQTRAPTRYHRRSLT